jgi:hypothetical protein
MDSLSQFVFVVAVSFLLTHELDAIRRREWRFFFAPVEVSEGAAYRIFTAVHVPLFVLLLWYLDSSMLRLGFDVFLIVHGFLHAVLRNHPTVEFDDWFSSVWIFGGSSLAILHLSLVL